ncbi:MAG: thioredoxin family protein [Acidobacteria bacterium CG_4_9_14_3_um_filter_49_7]|nr:MAG: thioredoxin family protein [Acidobacteria bacterium CG_4_9_14_3_um_filter_49_7]
MNKLTKEHLEKALSYSGYRDLVDSLLEQNKTTGNNHSDKMLEYSRLNVHRMSRIDRTTKLTTETVQILRNLENKLIWLVLTEAWCGDAAQNLPVIAKMASVTDHISLNILLRDENPDIMDAFLTNGGRAIPKLICMDANTLKIKWDWGPRPAPAQDLLRIHKTRPDESHEDFAKQVQLWYAKDKSLTLQLELLTLLSLHE